MRIIKFALNIEYEDTSAPEAHVLSVSFSDWILLVPFLLILVSGSSRRTIECHRAWIIGHYIYGLFEVVEILDIDHSFRCSWFNFENITSKDKKAWKNIV